MPAKKNKHGLTRDIPLPTKRQVRQACGFGCVKCGCAIYEYEHVEPTFAEAKSHDPEKIALLCHGCHGKVTTKFASKGSVAKARQRPWALRPGNESWDRLELDTETLTVELGDTSFVNTPQILVIDGEPLLEIHPPEAEGAPPTLSARFFDRNGNAIARIERNEWRGSADTFDIEAIGGRWTVRSASRKIDLVLRLNPMQGITVERCWLRYHDVEFRLQEGTIVITRGSTELSYPTDMNRQVERAPFGLAVDGERIAFGSDRPVLMAQPSPFTGPVEVSVEGGPFRFIDLPEEERAPLPPGFSRVPGSRAVEVSGDGTLTISLPNPFRRRGLMSDDGGSGAARPADDNEAEHEGPDLTALFDTLARLVPQRPMPSKAPYANDVEFGLIDGNVLLDFFYKTPKDRSWVGRVLLPWHFAAKVARGVLGNLAELEKAQARKAEQDSSEPGEAEDTD